MNGELLVKGKNEHKSNNIILYDKSDSNESKLIICQFENELKESIYEIFQNYINKMTKILPKRLFIFKEVTNCILLKIIYDNRNLFANITKRVENNLAIRNTLEKLSLCQGHYYFYYCENLTFFFYKLLYIPKIRIIFSSSNLDYYDIEGINSESKKEVNDENSNNSNFDQKSKRKNNSVDELNADGYRIKSKIEKLF